MQEDVHGDINKIKKFHISGIRESNSLLKILAILILDQCKTIKIEKLTLKDWTILKENQ